MRKTEINVRNRMNKFDKETKGLLKWWTFSRNLTKMKNYRRNGRKMWECCEENWSEKQLWNEILMTVSQRVKTWESDRRRGRRKPGSDKEKLLHDIWKLLAFFPKNVSGNKKKRAITRKLLSFKRKRDREKCNNDWKWTIIKEN